MKNIESYLSSARASATCWTVAMATEFARSLGDQCGAMIDWDEGAGESWIRLVAGKGVVAYVSAVLPFAIIERDAAPVGKSDSKVQRILVESMTNPELFGKRAALAAAFGDSPRLDTFDEERFSADDLWYATI